MEEGAYISTVRSQTLHPSSVSAESDQNAPTGAWAKPIVPPTGGRTFDERKLSEPEYFVVTTSVSCSPTFA